MSQTSSQTMFADLPKEHLAASQAQMLDFDLTEAVIQTCSVKKVFLEISQNLQENTCARVSFLINFIKKETLAQVISCEF